MNENIDLTKILKDCPKGTKLYSPALGECALEGVIDNNDYPIQVTYKIINNDTRFDYFTKDGYILLNKPDAECMLFPSKDQRDWNKWQRPFVKGDILVTEAGNIVLCSHIDEKQLVHYHCILNFLGTLKISNDVGVGHSYECTLANDFQKQKLFDALKANGYKWNPETKTLEKLKKEKFDPKTLQPFDKVLVSCNDEWFCDFFSHYDDAVVKFNCICTGGCPYDYCIPYNDDTKHLIGKTIEETPEFYRYWEK